MNWRRRIPGFRSGTTWKQAVAISAYTIFGVFALLLIIGLVAGPPQKNFATADPSVPTTSPGRSSDESPYLTPTPRRIAAALTTSALVQPSTSSQVTPASASVSTVPLASHGNTATSSIPVSVPPQSTSVAQSGGETKPITFDRTDFKGGFRADHFQIAVTLTNRDSVVHHVTAQANFYDTEPGHLGDDPAAHLATAGYTTVTLQPHESTAVLISANDIAGPTIMSVDFTATCKDGPVSDYCAQDFLPTTGR